MNLNKYDEQLLGRAVERCASLNVFSNIDIVT